MRRSQANACRQLSIEYLLLPDIDSRGHLSLFRFAAICVPKIRHSAIFVSRWLMVFWDNGWVEL